MFFKDRMHLCPRNSVRIKTGFSHEFAFPYARRESKVIQRILEMIAEIDLMRAYSFRFKYALHLYHQRSKFFQSDVLKHCIGEKEIDSTKRDLSADLV